MRYPKVVLHVVGRMDIGGAESRIMDLYRNIDRTQVQFAFMQHTTERCAFADEVAALGGVIYSVPRFTIGNYFAYKQAWKKFFKEHPEITAVHGHMTSTAAIYLPLARKAGIRTTIAHARSAGVDPGIKGWITRFMRRRLYQKCAYRFTCSELAAESVFGEQKRAERKARLIPNAIMTREFAYNEATRREIRYDLGLTDKFVIGHVGRFSVMKNHKYMLRILSECIKLEKKEGLPETMLMFLGDGELREEIMEQATELGISSRVLFLGNKRDVHRYYQAMDFFLLPSFYEGLPGTAIEAQAAGVPGILSHRITSEAIVTDLMTARDIKEKPSLWAEEILKESRRVQRGEVVLKDRADYVKKVQAAGYDAVVQAKKMQEFYLQNPKKVLFHINSMGKGGAERVVSLLAGEMVRRGMEVSVATLWQEQEEYALPEEITRVDTGLTPFQAKRGRLLKQWYRIANLRKAIQKVNPDLVISFCVKANYRAMMASLGQKIPVVVSVRNDPKIDYAGRSNRWMNRLFLNKAAGCVFQTQEAKAFFDPCLQEKSEIICNPVNEKYLQAERQAPRKKVACVGRLVAQKNQMLLVQAFEKVIEKYPEYELYLYGDGSDDECKEELLEYTQAAVLKGKIHFMGIRDNLERELADAAMFILPSNYEGMPNALMEAMALGLPVISTDCPCGGSRYWITNGENGQLVPVGDKDAMEQAMMFYIEHPEQAEAMGQRAKARLQEARLEQVYGAWMEFLEKCIEEYR